MLNKVGNGSDRQDFENETEEKSELENGDWCDEVVTSQHNA